MALKKRRIKIKRKTLLITGYVTLALIVALGSLYLFAASKFPDLSIWQLYENLASPSVRYIRITEGMRKEEVADRFAKTLGWTASERQSLIAIHTQANDGASEGYYFPDTYLVSIQAKPQDVSDEIYNTFNKEIIEKKLDSETNVINMDTIIKIASIIQREASDKAQMKVVSGIIWNRLFRGMTLDMDATLQYAKGKEGKWWPRVVPEDKKIISPYNTYRHAGLPPSAISNPGESAINAALNPTKTKALFYVHDANGIMHTAETYTQHKANIERYY